MYIEMLKHQFLCSLQKSFSQRYKRKFCISYSIIKNVYPFPCNTSIAISGTTGSGKTIGCIVYPVKKRTCYYSPPNVLYCYGIYQDTFRDMEKNYLSQISEQLNCLKENSIIILDGLARRIVNSQDMEELFTMGVHHRNLSVIYRNQNMY